MCKTGIFKLARYLVKEKCLFHRIYHRRISLISITDFNGDPQNKIRPNFNSIQFPNNILLHLSLILLLTPQKTCCVEVFISLKQCSFCTNAKSDSCSKSWRCKTQLDSDFHRQLAQTHKHTNTQTTNTQTHKHTNTQTPPKHKDSNLQTCAEDDITSIVMIIKPASQEHKATKTTVKLVNESMLT